MQTFRPTPSLRLPCLVAVCSLSLLASACDASFESGDGTMKVNGSITVPAGREPADVKTVNGSIRVEANGTVANATAVNGSVTLGVHAKGADLTTVNGAILLDQDAKADAVKSVNGALTLSEGAEISGALANVNGNISVTGAHVAGMIRSTAGDITLSGATKVDHGILIEKRSGSISGSGDPTIIIGPGVTVGGELRFERKVRLFVSDKATIGTVSGATAVTFSGDKPPNAT